MRTETIAHSRPSYPGNGIQATDINDYIIKVNVQASAEYIKQESARARHEAQHPTLIGVCKCADGRCHVAVATNTPPGIVKPWRAVGGRFRVGWPAFNKRLIGWNESAVARGARSLMFVTYHYSASHQELGCLGWKCDTTAARNHAAGLCKELKRIFGEQMTVILTGFETDSDNIILHSTRGDVSGGGLIGLSEDDVRSKLALAFPDVDRQTRYDIEPFLIGNARRVQDLTQNPRDLTALGHHERILAVGQCFDWLAMKNAALIINDVDPNLDDAIVKMAGILQENFEAATKDETFCIFTNVPYKLPGQDQRQAEVRAEWYQEFAQEHIKAAYPRFWNSGRLHYMTGVTFEHSRELKVLDKGRVK